MGKVYLIIPCQFGSGDLNRRGNLDKNMLEIPFINNPGKGCALACYTMTAQYFFPQTTFEEIAKISNWEPGYVVWPFRFWLWIMEKGIRVSDYDMIDLQAWASKGTDGLRQSIDEKDLNYYLKNTKDLEVYSSDIKKVISHPNFTYHKKRPVFSDLDQAYREGAVCEVVLDPNIIDGTDGTETHRIIVLEITKKNITFHDPRKNTPRPKRVERRELFEKAWLNLREPELCIYKK